jgi:integrase
VTVKRATWGKGDDKKETWAATFYDGSGKRHRRQGFDTKKQAEAWERQERSRLAEETKKPEDKIIEVAGLADEWLATIEKGTGERAPVDAGTLADYELSVRLYIKPIIGDDICSELTAPGMVEYRKKLLAKTTRKKAQRVLRHLRILFNYGVQTGYMTVNPALSVKIAADKREDDKVKIPSRAEMKSILDQLDKEVAKETASGHKERPWLRFAILFRLLQGAGLRVSEARGLAWNAVDLDNGVITVRQRASKKGEVGSPKSAAAYRSIGVSGNVIKALREWHALCPPSEL